MRSSPISTGAILWRNWRLFSVRASAFLLIVLMFRFLANERRLRISSELDAERLAVARAETEERAEEVRALNATLEQRVQRGCTTLHRHPCRVLRHQLPLHPLRRA